MNEYTGPLVYGGNSRGADRPLVGRADGSAPSVWQGSTRTPADLREQAVRLIEAQNPEASLTAAALYLREADRILAEAAQQFSEARQIADLAVSEHAKLAVDRERLAYALRKVDHERQELQARTHEIDEAVDNLSMRRMSLEALESKLMAQGQALESRETSLRVQEGEIMEQRQALDTEQKKIRRRPVEGAPLPMFPDSGPLHLRPNPRMARTEREFMKCLMTFKLWSGNRSLRQISEQSGGRISPSSVRNVLNSIVMPDRLEVVDAIVLGCGGSEEIRKAFASAWRRLRMGSGEITTPGMDAVPNEFE